MEQKELAGTVENIKKNSKLWIAILVAVVGILLLIFGGKMGRDKPDDSNSAKQPGSTTDQKLSMEEYRCALEKRICYICSQVDGVGNVSVIVSLESGFEYVYATDIKHSGSGESVQYIVIGSGSEEHVVYLTEKVPSIAGIGVVCQGGADPNIKRELTYLLSAAFEVSTNKIYVTYGN